MSKKDKLTKEQKEELQKLTKELSNFASDVVEDYKENPSEISGSVIEINENSPFLYEWLKGDKWKRVLTHIPPIKTSKNNDKDEDAFLPEDQDASE